MWLCFAHEAPRHVFRNLQRSQLTWIQLLATPLSACTVLIQSQSLERWEFYERVTTHSTSPRVRKPPSREPPEDHKTSSALGSNACSPAVNRYSPLSMARISPPGWRPQMHFFLWSSGSMSRLRGITETWKGIPDCGLFQKGLALPAGTGSFWIRSARAACGEAFIWYFNMLRQISREKMEAALVAFVQEQRGRIRDPRRASGCVAKAWWLAQKCGCPWRISANASNKKCGQARRHTAEVSAREFPAHRTAGMVALGSSFCYHLTPDGRACLLPTSYFKH